MCHIKN